MAESDLHELSAAYALDALDPDEEREFEEHLAGCARCRADVAAFRETAGALAVASPPAAPSARLRGRLLDTAREERTTVVLLRRRWVAPVAGGIAATAAAVAIGLGVWASSLHSDLSAANAERQSLRTAMRVVASPGAERIALSGGHGTLVVAPGGAAALVLDALGPAPSGMTYQAWVIEGRRPRSAAVFDTTDNRAVVGLTRGVTPGSTVAVTVERDGGADEPTGEPVFTASA